MTRMPKLRVAASVVLAALATTACHQEFEPPDRAARVANAEVRYSATAYDTITWGDESARLTAGNTAYAERCRRCHGTLGRGQTDYARERGLDTPSLVEAEWPLARLDSLRHKIFVGHESGMPIFGDSDLTLRDMDAVAAYILLTLRPEVLGSS